MPTDPTLRGSIRYAILELASFGGATICWAMVLGAAETTTMAVIAVLRTLGMAVVWALAVAPFRRFRIVASGEPRNDELLALDEAMSEAAPRFARLHITGTIASLVMATLVSMLGLSRPFDIGLAELVCGVLFLFMGTAILASIQFWVWEPFEGVRIAGRVRLHERGLVGRRTTTFFLRAQLVFAALTSIAIFFGVAGLGGMAHIRGRRDTGLVEQLRRAEFGALQVEFGRDPGDVEVVAETELPASLRSDQPSNSRLDVALGRSEALAAAAIGDGRFVLARAEIDEQLGWFVLFTLIVGACLSVPLMGSTLARARTQLEQFAELGRGMRALVETGKTRAVARIVARGNAEVDALTDDFNALLDMLDELTNAATKVASGDLRSEPERPGDLHDAFRGMVVHLHTMVVQIRATALDLASAAAEIHAITQEQELAVKQQSKRMSEVSEGVAELAAAAESITRTSAGVLDNAEQTLGTTSAMITRIGELRQQANSVSDLLERIRGIADRSDLLALNGSLEATRAGEAGRGFALVAAEMRRLAERVTQTVGDVHVRVVEIEGSGTNTVMAAEASLALAKQTAGAARQISLVTERQGRETELVAATVQEVTATVIATAGATSQTRAAAEGLRIQAELLERLTRQFELGQVDSARRSASAGVQRDV